MTEQERRPKPRTGWEELPVPAPVWAHGATAASRWQRGSVIVISSIAPMELPGGDGAVGPTWLVSITRWGKRPKPGDVELALAAFGMRGAEEDNHHPGRCRAFFLPVDPARRGICECKTTEDQMVEPDGYTWSNPKDDAVEACRGCELAAMIPGRRCPIHQEARRA
jgi:hypothetical protein